MEEEIALFEEFVRVSRGLASRHRGRVAAAAAGAAALRRADAPRAAAATLRGLLEFLPAAAVASHSPVPAEFLGLHAPLLDSDLLGRRWVKIPGGLSALVRGALRLGRLAVRALGGGERRGQSGGEVSGAQRGSHLEASPSIYSLSPTAASAAFSHDVQAGSAWGGAASLTDRQEESGRD